jgi:hypothetical protein
MKNLFVRVATVGLSLSILAALVAHASMTSGCSKTEPVKKDEPQVVPSAAVAAPVTPPPADPAPPAKPAADPPVVPAKTAPKANPAPAKPGGYMPATKSGGVFHPPQQSNAAPQVQK